MNETFKSFIYFLKDSTQDDLNKWNNCNDEDKRCNLEVTNKLIETFINNYIEYKNL